MPISFSGASMAELKLDAEVRSKVGKSHSRRLREMGRVPAVIYGKDVEPIHCSLNLKELEKALHKVHRNAIIQVSFGGKEKDQDVILRDFQKNPITHHYEHLDFQAIDMAKPVQVEVEIRLTGDPIGRKAGAILTVQLKTLRIECLPSKIPPFIEVDVSPLDVGHSLHVSDIPKGDFKVVSNPNLTICQMSIIKEEVVAAPAPVAATEAAPGAAPGQTPAAGQPAGQVPGAAPAPAPASTPPHPEGKKEGKH
jgi:large subunit ribosomal protein L25